MSVKPLLTADGSYTLYLEELDETYHSRHGALQESLHVFIQNGLEFVIRSGLQNIFLLEVGFGTGLNAWLTFQAARAHGITVHYTCIEPFPLQEAIWSNLNYAPAEQQNDFALLHSSEWNKTVSLNQHFELTKLQTTIQEVRLPESYFHLVYFDAFAPSKQPELWTLDVLSKTTASLQHKGVWVTYSAKGEVRRSLMQCGMTVERLPGPPGKKHMLRAVKH